MPLSRPLVPRYAAHGSSLMPGAKVTAENVRSLQPRAGRTHDIYFDKAKGALPGFALRVTSNGARSYAYVDIHLTIAFSLVWRKDNASPLLARFVAEVRQRPDVRALARSAE
jgi:hypothetical protein